MNQANPPAIVKAAKSELVARAKSLASTISQAERKNLAAAVELGKVLGELRPGCKRGEWGPLLKDIGVSSSRSLEYRKLAEIIPARGLSHFESIRAAVAELGLSGGEDEEPDNETPTAPPPDNHDTLIPELRARVAREEITPRLVPRVEAMDEAMQHALNARLIEGMHILAAVKTTEEAFSGTKQREAGDDTGNIRPRQTGTGNGAAEPHFEQKEFEHFYGHALKYLALLPKQYHLEGKPTEHPRFKAIKEHTRAAIREADEWQKELTK